MEGLDGIISGALQDKIWEMIILLKKPEYFEHVQMQTGGYGVAWDVNIASTQNI